MAICTICGFETEFLKQHMTNHGDDRKFQCDKCEKVVTGRKAFILGIDGDLEKCIVTCIIKDEGYEVDDEDIGLKDYKPTGQKRVLTIAKADGVPEIRAHVEILLSFPYLPQKY